MSSAHGLSLLWAIMQTDHSRHSSGSSTPHATGESSSHVLVADHFPGEPTRADQPLQVVAIPKSAALLHAVRPEDEVRVVALASLSSTEDEANQTDDADTAMDLRTADSSDSAQSGSVLLEPEGAAGPLILIRDRGHGGVRVNALQPPVLTPLVPGDEISILGSPVLLHVSAIVRGGALPAPPELIGVPCSLCLCEFTTHSRVVVCPGCKSAQHLNLEDDAPPEERLECAEIGSCPVCDTECPGSEDSFAYWPEA
jgi:hypothetical protein